MNFFITLGSVENLHNPKVDRIKKLSRETTIKREALGPGIGQKVVVTNSIGDVGVSGASGAGVGDDINVDDKIEDVVAHQTFLIKEFIMIMVTTIVVVDSYHLLGI